jgi:SAM-dependent methyltransferase
VQRSILSRAQRWLPGGARTELRRALSAYRSWRFRGDRFECPCCGGRFSALRAAGRITRANALCPRCGSFERHRLVWLHLTRRTDLFAGPRRLLNVAPEQALQEKLRGLPHLDYLSIDLESPLAMRRMDLTRLDLPDASFDAILCNHVLEHVPDDRRAMRELYRVLKPGGWAILQTPVDMERTTTDEDPSVTEPKERLRRFGQADHVRTYGRDFFDRLRSAGWRVTQEEVPSLFTPAEIDRYALDPTEALIIGRR